MYLNKKEKNRRTSPWLGLIFHRFPHLRFRSPGSLHLGVGNKMREKGTKMTR